MLQDMFWYPNSTTAAPSMHQLGALTMTHCSALLLLLLVFVGALHGA
jgi:hypothetical protein